MDNKRSATKQTEKIINTEPFSRIKDFFAEITENGVIYRLLTSTEMEELLIEKTNKLVNIFIEFNDEIETWDNENLYLASKNYIDEIFNNPTLQICLRYNISNIISYCRTFPLQEPFKSFFDKKLSVFRQLMHYIEQHKIDLIHQHIIEIEAKTMNDINENSKLLKQNVEELRQNINTYEKTAKKFEKQIVNYKKESINLLKTFSKIEKKVEDAVAQALVIVGIFTGLIIIFLGSISLLDAFKSFEKMSIYRLTFVTVLTGTIILNTVFFAMFLISRMAGKSVDMRCSKFKEKEKCNDINDAEDNFLNDLKNATKLLSAVESERFSCANCVYSDVIKSINDGYMKVEDYFTKEKLIEYKIDNLTDEAFNTYKKANNPTNEEFEKYKKDLLINSTKSNEVLNFQCGYSNKLIHKYPYVFFSNIFLLLIELFVILAWLFNKITLNNYVLIIKNISFANGFIILIPLSIIIFIFLLAYSIGKSNNWKNRRKYIILIGIAIIIFLIISLFVTGISFEKIKVYNTNKVPQTQNTTNPLNSPFTQPITNPFGKSITPRSPNP
ncbi:MAG: hypothetical protein FWF92_02870 [Oscillospiraceae bacterium]|nr:hypothetical protein [Oscillospiraceae bacterium]